MLQAGADAPDFTLDNLERQPLTLAALHSSGPVLLAFYKASCPTCQYTLPFLERLHAGGLPVAAISQDDAATAQRFRSQFGLGFPVLVDPAPRYAVSTQYELSTVPSLFLVEKDGEIAWSGAGFSRVDLEELGRRFGIEVFGSGERTVAFKPG